MRTHIWRDPVTGVTKKAQPRRAPASKPTPKVPAKAKAKVSQDQPLTAAKPVVTKSAKKVTQIGCQVGGQVDSQVGGQVSH